jgi:hypothetical protein
MATLVPESLPLLRGEAACREGHTWPVQHCTVSDASGPAIVTRRVVDPGACPECGAPWVTVASPPEG